MRVEDWLRAAIDDVKRRGLPIESLLEALARSTERLRRADADSQPSREESS